MKTFRCGRMENIVGCEWYRIQKRCLLGVWTTYADFQNRQEMERVANRLEKLGNIVIRMN